jgi:hypothetical protein
MNNFYSNLLFKCASDLSSNWKTLDCDFSISCQHEGLNYWFPGMLEGSQALDFASCNKQHTIQTRGATDRNPF